MFSGSLVQEPVVRIRRWIWSRIASVDDRVWTLECCYRVHARVMFAKYSC